MDEKGFGSNAAAWRSLRRPDALYPYIRIAESMGLKLPLYMCDADDPFVPSLEAFPENWIAERDYAKKPWIRYFGLPVDRASNIEFARDVIARYAAERRISIDVHIPTVEKKTWYELYTERKAAQPHASHTTQAQVHGYQSWREFYERDSREPLTSAIGKAAAHKHVQITRRYEHSDEFESRNGANESVPIQGTSKQQSLYDSDSEPEPGHRSPDGASSRIFKSWYMVEDGARGG